MGETEYRRLLVEPALLTVKQVAQALSVCEETVRRAIRSGEIAHVRVRWTVRVPRTELERLIEGKNEHAKS